MLNVRQAIKMSNDIGSRLPKKLPNDSPTRFWIGLSSFFGAFLESFDEIINIFATKSVDPPTDEPLIKLIFETIQKFNFVFKGMQAAKIPTLHLAIINFAKIISICTGIQGRMAVFGHHLLSGMKAKWLSEINHGHILAIALHPNFKSLSILNSCDMLRSLERPNIEELIMTMGLSMNYDEQIQENSIQFSDINDNIDIGDFMDPIYTSEAPKASPQKSVVEEYREFVQSKVTSVYEDPLLYWKDSEFEKLKYVAAAIFCVPVSSAEPERHNSAAGNIVTSIRNNLKPQTVESLVLLNESFKNSY